MKEVKLDIDNGDLFFADEFGVMHNPIKFIIDFRSISPRMDMRNKEFQPLALKHNVIKMDLFMAKQLSEVLSKNITNYEKKFGKIEVPEALAKWEKMSKKQPQSKEPEMPNYFG